MHYPPFGMVTPGRSYSAGSGYRYGFNGKEQDNEVKGEGNQQDYGMRVYDPRLGKFLSVDPLSKKYPWYTPYQFAGNKPIWAIDLDGLEELIIHDIGQRTAKLDVNKIIVIDKDLPVAITRAQSDKIAGNFTTGNGTYYFDKMPGNEVNVRQITEADYNNGNGIKLEVQFNISTVVVSHKEFKEIFNANGFNNKFSFVHPSSTITFSGDNTVFSATIAGSQEVFPNLSFFENYSLSNGSPTMEELLSHEVGFHNMIAGSETKDPKTGQGIYPAATETTLGSNTKGKILNTPANTVQMINTAGRRSTFGTDPVLESHQGVTLDNSQLPRAQLQYERPVLNDNSSRKSKTF